MSELLVRHKRRFGVVPDYILEEKHLSLSARAVAAWLAGRQDGFSIRVEVMKGRFLGITERRWKTIRSELEKIGWWRSTRRKSVRGKFEWVHEFSDTGFLSSDPIAENPTIPSKCKDGKNMDDFSIHGEVGHPKSRDNQDDSPHHDFYQNESTTTKSQETGAEEINQIIEAVTWSKLKSGGVIENPDAWKYVIRKRLQKSGPTSDDIEAMKSWRLYLLKMEINLKAMKEVRNRSPIGPVVPGVIVPEEELKQMIAVLKGRKSGESENE